MNARALFPATARRYRIARRPTEVIRPASPRPMRRDCHGRLLTALLDRAGAGSAIVDSGITGWASATFVGARHGVTLALRGEDMVVRAEALLAILPEAEFALAGHIVADLSIDRMDLEAEEVVLTLSILTIEAW
ncbi:MAG TPA: hypothetical protein VF463_08640 [Sphingobium sp.]